MSKKKIIVFEGIEGSGKSLHLKNISTYLKKRGIKHISFREPGGSKNSEIIRKLILNKKSTLSKKTDLLLYLASRNENIEKIIKKNHNKKIILIDRFVDSTIAYQHYGMGIDIKIIKNLNSFILGNIKPNFTFLHTVSKKNLKNRLSKRNNLNKYDKFTYSFYNKVQKGFIKISKKRKNKYFIVDSNLSIKSNKKLIQKKINNLI